MSNTESPSEPTTAPSANPVGGEARPHGPATAMHPQRPAPSPPPRSRRKHPSQGARIVALLSSVTATVGVGTALAYADSAAATSSAVVSAAAANSAAQAAPSGSASAATTAAPVAAAAAAPTSASTTAGALATGSSYADGTYLGAPEWTKWGNYQVQVAVRSGKIVSIVETQAPADPRSRNINSRAQPVLESEAIAAQSARINAVSGATYTSKTYTASLQSALDQAAKSAGAVTASAPA